MDFLGDKMPCELTWSGGGWFGGWWSRPSARAHISPSREIRMHFSYKFRLRILCIFRFISSHSASTVNIGFFIFLLWGHRGICSDLFCCVVYFIGFMFHVYLLDHIMWNGVSLDWYLIRGKTYLTCLIFHSYVE